MKKFLILFLVLVPCLPLLSLDLGFAADVYFEMDTEKEDSLKATETDVELSPAVVLMLSPQMEVRPFVVIGIHKESNPDLIPVGIDEDRNELYFGLGGGLYYHFIQGEIVSICAGPRLSAVLFLEPTGTTPFDYDSWFNLSVIVGIPVYLNVRLNDRLFFRAGVEIPGISFYTIRWDDGVTKDSFTNIELLTYDLGTFGGYIGFYFML